jgi:hypothetical protein
VGQRGDDAVHRRPSTNFSHRSRSQTSVNRPLPIALGTGQATRTPRPGSGRCAGRSGAGARCGSATPAGRAAHRTVLRMAHSWRRSAGRPTRLRARHGSPRGSAGASSPAGRAPATRAAAHDRASLPRPGSRPA